MAILAAWSGAATAGGRFADARQWLVRMFPHARRPGKTYQGWIDALMRAGVRCVVAVRNQLRQRMAQVGAACWKREGFVAFAVDGSRFVVPRTVSNQNGCGQSAHWRAQPQLWLTVVWHLGLGVPWDWRIGPGDSNERQHLHHMIRGLAAQALLVMDAGFAKYDLLRQIVDSGRHVLVRVGGNVTLLRRNGRYRSHGSLLWLWPKKRQRHHGPLLLRLVVLQGSRHRVYLLTSVLSPRQLSETQISSLYRQRWGVEVFYRGLKQTMRRRKLSSQTVTRAKLELHWLMLGAMLLGLMADEAQMRGDQPLTRRSFASVIRVMHRALNRPRWRGWRGALRTAVVDSYRRRNSKSSRKYPRLTHDSPPGPPKFRDASEAEIQQADTFRHKQNMP